MNLNKGCIEIEEKALRGVKGSRMNLNKGCIEITIVIAIVDNLPR